MRKIIMFLAASAAVLVVGVPASASAAQSPVLPGSDPYICLDQSPVCIATNGTGAQVNISSDSARRENFGETVQTGMCNDGRVTSNCPFTPGAGMNDLMIGDQIVMFNNGGNCLAASEVSSNEAVMEPCTTGAAYQLWVLYPQPPSAVDEIVNVGYSDSKYQLGGGYGKPYGLATTCTGTGCSVWMADVNPAFVGNYIPYWDLTKNP